VEPLAVVKDFAPFKDGSLGFGSNGELATMHQLAFEAAPKTFHGGVVATVARSAHAGDDARECQALPICLARILHPTIRMIQKSSLSLWVTLSEIGVHMQNMALNPCVNGLVEFLDQFHSQAVFTNALAEAAEQFSELRVRVPVFFMCGTPESLHASLLKREMGFDVSLQKSDEGDQKLNLLAGEIGLHQQCFQMVHMLDELVMLRIHLRHSGFKFFGPKQHGLNE
jgi:hypothetical protein